MTEIERSALNGQCRKGGGHPSDHLLAFLDAL
jgi:hypothetical protein